jgi:feruloyl esterase
VFQTLPASPNNGGYPTDALARGYAIAATDDGHAANPRGFVFDGTFALAAPGVSNTDALTDYFYRAVHTMAAAGKQFVQNWYAGTLARSYYFGCSDGGREGMVEVTRYPNDFDGYITGDPFFDVPGQTLAGKAAVALLAAPDAYIPPALLQAVDAAVHANCDAADGVQDGLIQNPGKCSFSPQSLLCQGGNTQNCLSQDQVNTLTRWFSAAKDQEGRVVTLGYPVSDIYNGGELGNNLYRWTEAAGPPLDINAAEPWGTSPPTQPPAWSSVDQTLKYFVYLDPNFDTNHNFPIDSRGVVNDAALALLVARTDIGSGDFPQQFGPFLTSGRKLIMYHGYSDGWINPFHTIRFYQDWARLVGGYDALNPNARLFMVPGLYHCQRGPGPNIFDTLTALERWVENNVPPEGIVATKYTNDDSAQPVQRTMPLCSFPTQAHLAAAGDMNQASNWSCAANQDLLQVGPDGALAGLVGPER